MMDAILIKYIQENLGQSIQYQDLIMSRFQFIELKKNRLLLERGEVCQYIYFVSKGCLQSYLYDNEMREVTREIVTEENWYCDLQSFNKQEPAVENIRTLESTELYRINRADFQALIETVPQFGKVYQKILEAYYNNAVYRINSFVSLSALDRIIWLMQYRPNLMTRVSSKVIASYLGIHKDVYSRLKNKL